MIKVKDWVAHIPQEEKRIAYVGEHESEQRRFLLTGEDAITYVGWTFHLDMQFDVSTVTTTSEKQVQTITEDERETLGETNATRSVTSQKETATERNVEVDCTNPTDIAYLSQEMTEEGLVLTWNVLSQHTQLPGYLWATIRAVGAQGEVKKSAVMVFEVESAVRATAAVPVSKSEFEQMEENMDRRVTQIETLANQATKDAARVDGMLEQLLPVESAVLAAAQEADEDAQAAAVAADKAEAAAAVTNAVLRESSVYVGTEEPQDEHITVWINPEGEATIDAIYNPASENAQSGLAVAQAVAAATAPKLDRSELADYVVEQATVSSEEGTVQWTYRKWNSGLAECWCDKEVVGAFIAQWGSMYCFAPGSGRLRLPIDFVETPKEMVVARASSSACFLFAESSGNGQNTSTTTAAYNVARPIEVTTEQTIKYSYYIVGKWK